VPEFYWHRFHFCKKSPRLGKEALSRRPNCFTSIVLQNIINLINLSINMKLQQMKNRQFFVTLPNQIVRAKEWKKGDDIKIEIDQKGNLILKK